MRLPRWPCFSGCWTIRLLSVPSDVMPGGTWGLTRGASGCFSPSSNVNLTSNVFLGGLMDAASQQHCVSRSPRAADVLWWSPVPPGDGWCGAELPGLGRSKELQLLLLGFVSPVTNSWVFLFVSCRRAEMKSRHDEIRRKYGTVLT